MRCWRRSSESDVKKIVLLVAILVPTTVFAQRLPRPEPPGAPAAPKTQTVDRIVALVNDQIILLSELAAASGPYVERAASEATDNIGRALARKQVREKILNDMIADKLVEEQAKELGINVSEREIDTEVARIKKENNLDDAGFAAEMQRSGMDPQAFREQIRKQKQRQKVIEVRVQPRV